MLLGWFGRGKKKKKVKCTNGGGELTVFTEGNREGGQLGLGDEGGFGLCSFDGSGWKIFPPTRV